MRKGIAEGGLLENNFNSALPDLTPYNREVDNRRDHLFVGPNRRNGIQRQSLLLTRAPRSGPRSKFLQPAAQLPRGQVRSGHVSGAAGTPAGADGSLEKSIFAEGDATPRRLAPGTPEDTLGTPRDVLEAEGRVCQFILVGIWQPSGFLKRAKTYTRPQPRPA